MVPGRGDDLFQVTLDAEHGAEALLSTEFNERNAALSHDGRWLAHESDESGRFEIYVRPFPDVQSGRFRVSTSGGVMPVWGPGGGELFYLQGTQMMVVAVETTGTFTHGVPYTQLNRQVALKILPDASHLFRSLLQSR